ncbi:hypothetical protein V5O48_003168 [Marasmius crinis-equi]|uniref:Auxin efflux carrier n=1 Tax=Marasmius crinis-equi TaxID=585013 RepID=A0ABR3FTN8_9AGAR
MSRSAESLIYSGIAPLVKTYLTVGLGYLLARRDLFPSAASRGASQIAVNVASPCLIFSSMVLAFDNENIADIGPLSLVACIYMLAGFLGGVLIREWFYVPRNFWYGIIVLTTISNWGNLPVSILMTVTKQAPFDPITDPDLAVSYVSVFTFTSTLVFWGFLANTLAWDYAAGVPQGVDAEKRYQWYEKPIGGFFSRYLLPRPPAKLKEDCEHPEKGCAVLTSSVDPEIPPPNTLSTFTDHPGVEDSRSSVTVASDRAASILDHASQSPPHRSAWARRVLRILATVISPNIIAIMISIPCAVIPQLKALFVLTENGPFWKAPDGRPPLSVIYDLKRPFLKTAKSVGSLTVPLSLILLGASFARAKVPRPLSRLPIPAMLAASALKLVIIPAMGVLLVQGMVQTSLIPVDAKAEKFVAMFLAGTPPAVNQLIISSLYCPDGELDTLTAFLLVQYFFMFFSSA